MMCPSESRWDVIVIGGGPAGSIAASLLAKQSFRVGLVHRAETKSDWPEVLSPEGTLQLRELGYSEEQLSDVGASCLGVMEWSAEDEPSVRDFELFHTATGRFVSRRGLAEMLRTHAIRSGSERIALNRLDLGLIQQARFVIDASGLNSPRNEFPKTRLYLDSAIGVCFRLGGVVLHKAFLHLTSLNAGWMYLTPGTENEPIAAVFVTDKNWVRRNKSDLEGALRNEIASSFAFRSLFAGLSSIKCVGFRDSRTSCRKCLWSGNWLPIGDAAYAVNPITGGGLARSIRMASQSAKAVTEFLNTGSSFPLQSFAYQQVEDFQSLASSISVTPFFRQGVVTAKSMH